jgi:mono/diheme cytochrome c family protein
MRVGLCGLALAACTASAPSSSPAPAPESPAARSGAAPAPDPYHPVPRDTVDNETYQGWKQYSLHCARCHGDDALGSTFGPSLVDAFGAEGDISDRQRFGDVLHGSRAEKGMPSAAKMGLDSTYFEGIYRYLAGRGQGRLKGGRPARLEATSGN